jgi:hypothetical protein
MRPYLKAMLLVLLAAAAACGHKAADTAPSLPPLLIDDRGISMPLEKLMPKLNYRPWIPPGQVLKYAGIPPLGGAIETPDNDGFAVEYVTPDNHPMLLSEWPKQNFQLQFLHHEDITFTPCHVVFYKSDGVAWTTHGKLAMTLQPDGSMRAKDVEKEANRLIAVGACK